jgi:Uma2 family endonuclease
MSRSLGGIPELCAGDRLTRDEFERRYSAMPHCKKAELVEGVVYMPSPVNQRRHAGPHARIVTWLGHYIARTPGVEFGDNATVRLDLDNEVQPDVHVRIPAEIGGGSRIGLEGYVEGPPELAVEVAASSASYDLHDKLRAYRRNGVREYLVWRVDDDAVDWFELRAGRYERLPQGGDGVVRSAVYPGLWLDVPALLRDDLAAVLVRLDAGMADADHAAFVARLRR